MEKQSLYCTKNHSMVKILISKMNCMRNGWNRQIIISDLMFWKISVINKIKTESLNDQKIIKKIK